MNKLLYSVAVLGIFSVTEVSAQDTTRIAVIATTDVHGRAMHWDYALDQEAPLGLTRVATLVDSLRTLYAGNVVVVDAGDLIQGNPLATVFSQDSSGINPIIDVMNSIGYDAMTLGNHEFNYGLETLNRILADAEFTVLGANVFPVGSNQPAYRSAIVTRRGGVNIGIAGFTTPGSMIWDRANLAEQLQVRPILPIARTTMTALEDANADLIVVLAHSGLDEPSSYDDQQIGSENVAADLAKIIPAPDIVVVGHSHKVIEESVQFGVHFMQPRNWAGGVSVAHVTLVSEGDANRVVDIRTEHVEMANIEPSAAVTRRLERAHDRVRRWTTSAIASTEGNWSARFARIEDTPIIDFINEVQRRAAGTQLSTTSAFNIDAGLGPNAVTFGDISALYPYENTLRAVLIDGATLREYLEQSAAYFTVFESGTPFVDSTIRGYNYDIVSGVNYTIDVTQPAGSRIRQLTYNGTNVLETDTFTMAVNSYRQVGGGSYDMFKELPVVYDQGENVRDLLIEATRSIGTLNTEDFFAQSWRLMPTEAANAIRQAQGGTFREGSLVLRVMATAGVAGQAQPATAEWSGDLRVGGLLGTKAFMDSAAAQCRCPTLRLDGGNSLSGTAIANFTNGRAIVEGFGLMGTRASALGLSDIQLNADTLQALAASAGYSFLSSNIVSTESGQTPTWIRPWVLVESEGVRIAAVGFTGAAGGEAINTGLYTINGSHERLGSALAELSASTPDFTVLLTDAAISCEGVECSGELVDLASNFDSTQIDFIVAPGSPTPVSTTVNGISIFTTGNGSKVAVVDLMESFDGEIGVSASVETVWADVPSDARMAALIQRHQEATDQIVGQQITTLRTNISRSDEPEYPLGRLVADALRNAARTNAAIIPNSHIAADLERGPLTYGDLFAVLPENQEIVVLEVSGALLKETLEWVLFDALPSAHVAGVRVRYDPERTPGRRIRDLRFPDDRSVQDDERYTLAIPGSLHAGENLFPMLWRSDATRLGISELDALAAYLGRLPAPVQAPRTTRFSSTR